MRYRRLGSTDLRVSEIGFGAWGIGGVANGAVGYGPTDDRESRAALRRAFDLGVTFFDTADIYGFGHSEELIGETLADVRSRIVFATKGGMRGPDGPQDFSPRYLRGALEASLRRLRTDYVDLYQLHNPSPDQLIHESQIVDTIAAFQREGKARAVGISLRSPADGLVALRTFGFGAVQVNFSLVDQRARLNGLLELCATENVGVVCRTPLCYGFLSGAYAADRRFDAADHRARWPVEQLARWAEAPELFGAALTCGRETPAQRALRFCLSYPSITTAIPGMLTSAQVEENVDASMQGPLADTERVTAEAVYQREEFFVGRASTPTGRA